MKHPVFEYGIFSAASILLTKFNPSKISSSSFPFQFKKINSFKLLELDKFHLKVRNFFVVVKTLNNLFCVFKDTLRSLPSIIDST